MYTGRNRRIVPAMVAASVLIVTALAGAQTQGADAASAAAASQTVRIKDEAFIKGPKVYLSDLVEVEEGDLKDRLADIEVSSAAQPGDSKALNASLVEARLQHAGIDLDEVSVVGPQQVRATTMHLDLTPEMLSASLRDYIESEMPWELDVTEVDVPLSRQTLMAPEGELAINWRANPQYNFVGPSNFRGEITIDGELFRTVALRASVETYQEIVVAATDISRGRPVTKAHLKMQMVALSRAPEGAITSINDAVGMIARKTIFPNQPITARNVEAQKLIKRNQTVLVEVNTGSIHIQHQARAMMDGRAGDVIICANPSTREEFQGIVRADGVVEVQ